jgi:hypothetical protein
VDPTHQTLDADARSHAASVFGNHWPSRSGGQFRVWGYRAIVARMVVDDDSGIAIALAGGRQHREGCSGG